MNIHLWSIRGLMSVHEIMQWPQYACHLIFTFDVLGVKTCFKISKDNFLILPFAECLILSVALPDAQSSMTPVGV